MTLEDAFRIPLLSPRRTSDFLGTRLSFPEYGGGGKKKLPQRKMQLRPRGIGIDMYSAPRHVQSIAGQATGILSAIHTAVHRDLPPDTSTRGCFVLETYRVSRWILKSNDNIFSKGIYSVPVNTSSCELLSLLPYVEFTHEIRNYYETIRTISMSCVSQQNHYN